MRTLSTRANGFRTSAEKACEGELKSPRFFCRADNAGAKLKKYGASPWVLRHLYRTSSRKRMRRES